MGLATHARIGAGPLAIAVLLSGCAQRIVIFPEATRAPPSLRRTRPSVRLPPKENADQAEVVGKGLGRTLVWSVSGAGAGALLGLAVVVGMSADDPGTVGLIIAGGAGAGAVIGWFVGTGMGIRASARHAQERS